MPAIHDPTDSANCAPQITHSFGAMLRQARRAANLSQTELAERAGMSRSAISSLERGLKHRPHSYTVGALADALRLAPVARAALASAARAPRSVATAFTPVAASVAPPPAYYPSLTSRGAHG